MIVIFTMFMTNSSDIKIWCFVILHTTLFLFWSFATSLENSKHFPVVFMLTFHTSDKIESMGEQLQGLKKVSDMLSYHNEKVNSCN